jgi:hypothetical protein
MTTHFVSPNLWTLSGEGISIRYSQLPIIGPAGNPHLIYQDSRNPSNNKTFSADEIRTVSIPDLGEVISVTLHMSVDTGSTTLSLLLPVVNIVSQGPVSLISVTTDAIITSHAGPLSPPFGHGQKEFYTVIPLTGTAAHVLVA